jgi:hypothetical protein
MTARANTKEYSHFLVKWDSGDEPEYLVVPRSKILSEGRIKLQERYNTIWVVVFSAAQVEVHVIQVKSYCLN